MADDSNTWKPKRTLAECHTMMCGPGAPFETHHIVVDGLVYRMYKNAPQNLRLFFLAIVRSHAAATFIVYENERYTFKETFDHASRAASIFRDVYGIHKGDRVAIVMRNYPEWIFCYWACYLLGAVPVLVNAFVPAHIISHCITLTTCKLIVLDAERSVRLATHLAKICTDSGATGVLVVVKKESDEKRGFLRSAFKEGKSWDDVMNDPKYTKIVASQSWKKEPECNFSDDSAIFFTSGTTGFPKGVLTNQLASIAALFQVPVGQIRGILRKGETFPLSAPPTPQRALLLSIPLFHVTGGQAILLGATMAGGKLVLMHKWDVEKGIKLIKEEKVTAVGGIPSVALDLLGSEDFTKNKHMVESVGYGGTAAPPTIPRAVSKLPGAPAVGGQGYGLTETSGGCVSVSGEDYLARPLSTGVPLPITDMLIVDSKTRKEVPVGQIGEIWLRGPQVMKCYWKNPEATAKVLTRDGWFNSEDLGYVDSEGFLFVKGRVKDLIIRGGENIDAVSIENALYEDGRVLSCAAVAVPDARLGELPVAFAVPKPGVQITEVELLDFIRPILPAFAVPVMLVISTDPLPTNAAGKILKTSLRKKATDIWEQRGKSSKMPKAKL